LQSNNDNMSQSEYARKNRIYALLLIATFAAVYLYREYYAPKPPTTLEIKGETMGTYYSVKYLDEDKRNFKVGIDSVLIAFNQSLSTYIQEAEISQFNLTDTFYFISPYFPEVLYASKEIFEKTGGAFDPTIMPLVKSWGFGPGREKVPDSARVDSLLKLVDFEKIRFDDEKVWKMKSGMMLDFSAIAKGQGVDVVADFVKSQGIENFLVEIGGEIVANGKNAKGETWRVGINRPDETSDFESLELIVQLEDRAIATSGNYRNFRVVEGKKFAHTISPFTGYPVQHSLLSASVFAKDCMTADAFATAFMVMGIDKAKEILAKETEIDAILIYADENGDFQIFQTDGIASFIVNK
jgi:FAD:protein FMN transferase